MKRATRNYRRFVFMAGSKSSSTDDEPTKYCGSTPRPATKDNTMRRVALGLGMLASAAISVTAVNGLRAQEMARSAYDTPVWKTITLGTYKKQKCIA